MQKQIDIKRIFSNETLKFRHKYLRPDEPIEECMFEGDNNDSSIHFGAFSDDTLLGVISMYPEASPKLAYDNQWRLRGMAVLPKLRGQGIGKKLMQQCIKYGKSINASVLWGNARSTAIGFHIKQNFQLLNNEFELERKGINSSVRVKVQFIYMPLR